MVIALISSATNISLYDGSQRVVGGYIYILVESGIFNVLFVVGVASNDAGVPAVIAIMHSVDRTSCKNGHSEATISACE